MELIEKNNLVAALKSSPDFGFSGYAFASTFVDNTDHVLDIGCANGHGSLMLLNAGAKTVTGGDINPKAIQYAKTHYRRKGLEFLCLDAANLSFADDCFDVVVASQIIEHLPEAEQRKFLSGCRGVLRNGGRIICSTPNKQVYSISKIKRSLNRSHMKEYCIPEFYDLLSEYFVDVTLYGQSFMNPVEIIEHKSIMVAQFVVGGILSLFPKADEVKLFVYAAITRSRLRFRAMFRKDRAYRQESDISLLSNNSSRQPLDVIAVARAVKKEAKPGI